MRVGLWQGQACSDSVERKRTHLSYGNVAGFAGQSIMNVGFSLSNVSRPRSGYLVIVQMPSIVSHFH